MPKIFNVHHVNFKKENHQFQSLLGTQVKDWLK